jgi:hypothetical protein
LLFLSNFPHSNTTIAGALLVWARFDENQQNMRLHSLEKEHTWNVHTFSLLLFPFVASRGLHQQANDNAPWHPMDSRNTHPRKHPQRHHRTNDPTRMVELPTIANQINALAQVGGIPIRSIVFIAEQRLQVPYI